MRAVVTETISALPSGKYDRPQEPFCLWCEECLTVVFPAPGEELPASKKPIVKGQFPGHPVAVLSRSKVRELASDVSAADALDRLVSHRLAAVPAGR